MLDERLRARRRAELRRMAPGAPRRARIRWRKERPEAYLNLVSWRGELQSVAATRGLFDKHPGGLDLRGVGAPRRVAAGAERNGRPRSRGACAIPHPRDGGRRDWVTGLSDWRRCTSARNRDRAPDAAPHLARGRAQRRRGGDGPDDARRRALQRFARDALARHLAALAGRNVEDGAVLVLDNATGDVLAYVASSGDLSGAEEVDGITARRQAGSTLKPFLYADAIGRRLLTAASLLDDARPRRTPVGLYVPQNYDRSFKGVVGAHRARRVAQRRRCARSSPPVEAPRAAAGARLASLDRPAGAMAMRSRSAAPTSLLELAKPTARSSERRRVAAVRSCRDGRRRPTRARSGRSLHRRRRPRRPARAR
jgi:penicillin-binding protein 1C